MKQKSVMSHSFSQVPHANIQRSTFNRSHGIKTTFDAGFLIPIYVDEALPGDTFNLNMTTFARLSTPIVPIMDNIFLDSFFFAVPLRLLWTNFQRFMGEQDPDPGDSTSYLVPQMAAPASVGHIAESLSDYFGLPTDIADYLHNSLHHRAYNLIWNQWFRDENLQDSATVDLGDGPDTSTNYFTRRRGKRHDYFTSCLPWPQKGTAVSLPLGSVAPVLGIGKANQTYTSGPITVYETNGSATTNYADASAIDGAAGNNQWWGEEDIANAGYPSIYADLTNATAATINDIREAFQLQKMYERDARGGTRYTEIIRSHFGVTSPDARLQRPEYLGGGSQNINMHVVPQTSQTATTAQGNVSAFATSSGSGHGFTKSFTEHCVIIGLISARADLNYQQGMNRMFDRQTKFDFFWPALAQIGEQAVLNKEIYLTDVAADELTFGYQERYAEYRYKPSQVTGKFRSTYSTPLDMWHLAQEYSALPVLNATFIQETPPMDRILAVTDESDFLLDGFINLKCARPMPTYGVPGLIDHF